MSTTSSRYSLLLVSLLLSFFLFSSSIATSTHPDFLECMSLHSNTLIPIYTTQNSSYSSILQSNINNLRFNSSTAPKAFLIITPLEESHVQTIVICSRKHGIHIRVRSGGHDLEGLSYTADVPFIVVDLFNLREINVDVKDEVAWVQSGATIGEVNYKISEKSNTLGFPAGFWATVGTGGHFSGGGYGSMSRKYGTASDNVIDARVVDVNGRILDKISMGEGLFWAIRGGGGGSFGIVLSWKIKLVLVPPTVTIFSVDKTLAEGATSLLHKWQNVAHLLPQELFIFVMIGMSEHGIQVDKSAMVATFRSLFLGNAKELKIVMNERFPELGLDSKDFIEMSWIQSVLFLGGFPANSSTEILYNTTDQEKSFFKGKSDYVRQPISHAGLELIWKRLLNDDRTGMVLMPYGGRMSEISESETPFPHRDGILFDIFYCTIWDEKQVTKTEKFINQLRTTYEFMTPYVSKNPREAYVNYLDLDLGRQSTNGTASYLQAAVWGTKYFKGNFDRLVSVKSKVDPDNFFRNEQSIPCIEYLSEQSISCIEYLSVQIALEQTPWRAKASPDF